ncbi:MAG TPA: hypothetical protein VIG08_03305 [Gemmatimonadales bacterium]|jgi:hypothetical protein
MRRGFLWFGSVALLTGCSGLTAGPEVAVTTPVPVSRDSAYTRAHRGLIAESFTFDVLDSTGGRLTATRFPSANAQMGSAAACRVKLALDVTGSPTEAEIETNSRWISAEPMLDKAPTICEQERQDVLSRVAMVIAPPPPQ